MDFSRLFSGYLEEEIEEDNPNDEGAVVMPGSYLEMSKTQLFGIGHDMRSHTNETVWKVQVI